MGSNNCATRDRSGACWTKHTSSAGHSPATNCACASVNFDYTLDHRSGATKYPSRDKSI